MGYFSRLQKRSRSEAGWTSLKYTGSAAAGADLVSEETWCVVYGANVVYQGAMERISALTLSTNFVNPLSSGNPCTVSCYLYSQDPSSGGDFDVSAPPPGYLGCATLSFEASTVGDYVSFAFPGLDMRPEQLWFWFCSSVSYESFGSNSIYHYATGNYSAALNTGTKTPALTGSFSGTDDGSGSGGVEGEEYTAVASGSYSSIFAQRDFSYSRPWHSASYTALSFTGSGEAEFYCCHGGEGDSFLQLRSYLTAGSGFDKYGGRPTGTVIGSGAGADSCGFTAQVESGRTYYLWVIIDYCGTDSVPLNVSVRPAQWSYSLSNKGSISNIAQNAKTVSMSMAAFETGRMTLSFAYSSYAEISVSAEGAFSAVVLVSTQQNIDNATGLPLEYSESFSLDSMGSMFIEKGKTYYFFAIYNGGSEAGKLSFTVSPPSALWTQGAGSSFSKLKSGTKVNISLGTEKYHRIKLSTAYSGFLWLSGSGIKAGNGSMCVYVCEKDCFDSHYGYPYESLTSLYLNEGYETPVDLIAGRDYYIYVLNTDPLSTLSAALSLVPASPPESYSREASYAHQVESSFINEQYIRRYSYTLNTLIFRYRGEAVLSLTESVYDSENTPQLRAYLCTAAGMDESSGIPSGPVICSYTSKGESFSLTADVEEDREYSLYIVCEELYGGYTSQLELSVISPPARYFSITETGEYYALSEPVSHSAEPGESGVLRLELSYSRGGWARLRLHSLSGSEGLMAWVSASPYLDGRRGMPAQEIIKSAAGTPEEPQLYLSFPVRKLESLYLFVRGRGIYDAAQFTLDMEFYSAGLRIYTQDGYKRALPYIFHGGSWHRALPLCRSDGSWHLGG